MKRGTKKIKNWIRFFSKEDQIKIRYNIRNQVKDKNFDTIVKSQSQALIEGFTWNESPEDFDYWNNIYDDLKLKGK